MKKNFLLRCMTASIIAVLFLCLSCATSKCGETVSKLQSDSTVYSDAISDSIVNIVDKSHSITAKLKHVNRIDTIACDSVRVLNGDEVSIFKFLFFDPQNFKSNEIVYGIFSPTVEFSISKDVKESVVMEIDFGLKKWQMTDKNGDTIYIADIKDTSKHFLRLTRLLFPNDSILNLMEDNLNNYVK